MFAGMGDMVLLKFSSVVLSVLSYVIENVASFAEHIFRKGPEVRQCELLVSLYCEVN